MCIIVFLKKILGDVKKLTFNLHHLRLQHKEEIINMGLTSLRFESPLNGIPYKDIYPKMKRKQPGRTSKLCTLNSNDNDI